MIESGLDHVARFVAAWQRYLHENRLDPPLLADYVPDGAQARLAVLTDLVRIDLRQRWIRPGGGKRIMEYRKEFPEIEQSPILADLVYEEFLARRRHAPVDATAFLAEYPDLAAEVRERLSTVGADDETQAEPAELDSEQAAALVADLTPGRRIDDFDLRTDLGTGALGRVFLATQRSMQRLVAVRFSAGISAAPRTMAQLDHPHIVRVFDQRMPAESAALRLVYMQYLPGGTAEDVLAERRRGPESAGGDLLLRAVDAAMEVRGEIRQTDSSVRAEIAELSWPETVAWLGRRLADALDYAARQGVLHRAIKPSNVLFTAEGSPKLADFTLHDSTRTRAQHDSSAYRSPEELALELDPAAPEPDTRSDIFSLGTLLWEMLTGSAAFDDEADTEAARLDHRRRGVRSTALERIPADCPAALRRVLLTCLEPDPERRWPNGATLAQQLDLCLDDRARNLVDPPERSWRRALRRWRILLVTLAVAVPNALASVYNVEHNAKLIHYRQTQAAQHQFEIFTAVSNGVAFSLGTVVLVYLSRYLIFVPHGLRTGVRYSPEVLHRTRTDAVLLGDRAVLVIFSMWLLSGISFPVVLYATSDAVTAADYAHFVGLHVVSGAIALTYPFFLVNFYIIRCVYPMFLSHGEIHEKDVARLHGLRRRSAFYLSLAASIPLLAVAGATLLAPPDLAKIIVNVRVLCIGSIIAFVAVYILFRAMENDLRALERMTAPHQRAEAMPAQ
ncbi:protein kinase domain-containing protein [Nocardia sp. KC 131]|uniref:protein kinase domain-containing protein n=1 Tax=Nocardia arseniciresistens TaxID=3392119 RepID=UPI00398F6BB9